jgi:hypothetical protein
MLLYYIEHFSNILLPTSCCMFGPSTSSSHSQLFIVLQILIIYKEKSSCFSPLFYYDPRNIYNIRSSANYTHLYSSTIRIRLIACEYTYAWNHVCSPSLLWGCIYIRTIPMTSLVSIKNQKWRRSLAEKLFCGGFHTWTYKLQNIWLTD